MANEMTTAINGEKLVTETNEYSVFQLPNGKFEKRVKYQAYSSIHPETTEEQVMLYNLLNGDEALEMKAHIGTIFEIMNVVFSPYDSFDEETGVSDAGVSTIILGVTDNGEPVTFATSSKTVYWDLQNMFKVFCKPDDENYLGIKVAITGTKQQRGTQIGLKLLGLSTPAPKDVTR